MANCRTVLVLSDIHYASAAEKERRGYETTAVPNPLLRLAVKAFRHYLWLRDPLAHNHLLDRVIDQTDPVDYVVANGDYSCDSAFVGVSDDAACESARQCLGKLRRRFGSRLHATFGDHELGKMSLFGGRGGMRLASWHRAQNELGLVPRWHVEIGNYLLTGVVSSLVALPVYETDTLPDERAEWQRLREAHLSEIRRTFMSLRPDQRVLLFCHDPTALPFLWQLPEVRQKAGQIEHTFIGHLHSDFVFWKSRVLAGIPTIGFLGNSIRRMSRALSQARDWRPFNVRLCPSLAGIELLKDGGYYLLNVDSDARQPVDFQFRKLRRS